MKNTKTSKKLWALLLAAVLTFSMGVSAFAAEDAPVDPFWTTNQNLTNAPSTNYNYVITLDEEDEEEVTQVLEVTAADSAYARVYIPADLVGDVKWSMLDGGDEEITFNQVSVEGTEVGGKYAAKTTLTIPENPTPGLSVFEAKSPAWSEETPYNGMMDFTIVVNPKEPQRNVTGVKVYAYNGNVTKDNFITKNTNTTVKVTSVASTINYPTAMDAVAGVSSNYKTEGSWGSIMLSEVTFTKVVDGKTVEETYPNKDSAEGAGWMYRVYDNDGKMMQSSAVAGAETFNVKTGYTVVWAFGTYDSVNFPNTFSEAAYTK